MALAQTFACAAESEDVAGSTPSKAAGGENQAGSAGYNHSGSGGFPSVEAGSDVRDAGAPPDAQEDSNQTAPPDANHLSCESPKVLFDNVNRDMRWPAEWRCAPREQDRSRPEAIVVNGIRTYGTGWPSGTSLATVVPG
jgi:hypothetical protein